LAVSDLSPRSDAAIAFAGSLARFVGAELHLFHAMGLTHRPMRSVLPALSNLSATVRAAEGVLREQLQRAVPPGVVAHSAVVDVIQPDAVVRSFAAECAPMAIIASTVWDWPSNGSQRRAKERYVLSTQAAPTVIVRERRQATHNRVVVISSIDTFKAETIEAAGRWGFWLEQVYGFGRPSGPELDVVMIDEDGSPFPLVQRLLDPRCDLIAVDRSIFQRAELAGAAEQVMSLVLAQTAAPIALVSTATRNVTTMPPPVVA
jgi:hypothetical protein